MQLLMPHGIDLVAWGEYGRHVLNAHFMAKQHQIYFAKNDFRFSKQYFNAWY